MDEVEALEKKLKEETDKQMAIHPRESERMDVFCIFLPTGRTFTFKNVKIIQDNETVLQFGYRAMSDGRIKVATFPKMNVAGWSVTW